MEIAKLILDFLKILIWPVLVLLIAIRYRRSFDRLIKRFCEETEEITSSSLGISAKFRSAVNNLSQISSQLPDTQQDVKTALDHTRRELIQNQIRELSTNFFRGSLSVRGRTANQIYDIATEAGLDFALDLAKSESPGERVAAGVCIKAIINANPATLNDERVTNAIQNGARDVFSRVRYRFLKAIVSRDELISRFQRELTAIAKNDDNEAVRHLAKTILSAI